VGRIKTLVGQIWPAGRTLPTLGLREPLYDPSGSRLKLKFLPNIEIYEFYRILCHGCHGKWRIKLFRCRRVFSGENFKIKININTFRQVTLQNDNEQLLATNNDNSN